MSKLNEQYSKAEGLLCGLVLKNPSVLYEYTIDRKQLSPEALFYIGITNKLIEKGVEVIDEVSFASESENLGLIEKYNIMGGWNTIREMTAITDVRNCESIIDNWSKWLLVKNYNDKGILDVELHWDKLVKMTSIQVYSYLEHEINSVSITTGVDGLDFENLVLTDEELEEIVNGANIGLQFNSKSPILNSMCLGMPKAELNAICGYINEGKTSFAFSNFVMPIVNNGHKSLIISTEQRSIVFKLMLVTDVLVNKLDYFKITRKKLKTGKYTSEDSEMIKKAMEYIKKEYSDKIAFLKLYNYNTDIVTKAIKKYAQLGYEFVLYDVLKFDSGTDDQIWKSLIDDSKNLFQCCSKYNVSGLVTLQLAMATKNKIRQIGMECVANSKAVFEVMSEAIFIRSAWDDEIDEESVTYLKPYRLKRDVSGKFTGEKEEVKLNPDKQYKIVRLGKSRNDSTDKFLLYQVDFNYNIWKEIGYCHVSDKNKY